MIDHHTGIEKKLLLVKVPTNLVESGNTFRLEIFLKVGLIKAHSNPTKLMLFKLVVNTKICGAKR